VNSPGLSGTLLTTGVDPGDPITFTVSLNTTVVPSSGVTVKYTTKIYAYAPATAATPGYDYTTQSGTLTFPGGSTTTMQTVTLSTINPTSSLIEPQKTIALEIYDAIGVNLAIGQNIGIGTIKGKTGTATKCSSGTFALWTTNGNQVGCGSSDTVTLPEVVLDTIKSNVASCIDTDLSNFPKTTGGCPILKVPPGTNVDYHCSTKVEYTASYKCEITGAGVPTWVERNGTIKEK
jgi:hypothetical protein